MNNLDKKFVKDIFCCLDSKITEILSNLPEDGLIDNHVFPGTYEPSISGIIELPVGHVDTGTGDPVIIGTVELDLSDYINNTTYELTGALNADPTLGYDVTLTGSDGTVNVVTVPVSPDTTYELSGALNVDGDFVVTLTGSDGSTMNTVVPLSNYQTGEEVFVNGVTFTNATRELLISRNDGTSFTATIPNTTYDLTGAPNPVSGYDITLTDSDGTTKTVTVPVPVIKDDGSFVADDDPAEACNTRLIHVSSSGSINNVDGVAKPNTIILDPASTEHTATSGAVFNSHAIYGENPTVNNGLYLPDSGDETRGQGPTFMKVVDQKVGCGRYSHIYTGHREAGVSVVDSKFYSNTPRVERIDHPFQTVGELTVADRAATETVRFFSNTLITGNVLTWDTDPGSATLDFTGVEGLQGILDILGTGRVTVIGRPTVLSYRQQTASKAIVDLFDVVNDNAGTNSIRLSGGAEARINAMDVSSINNTGTLYVVNGAKLDLNAQDLIRSGTSGTQGVLHITGTGTPETMIRCRDIRCARGTNTLDIGGASSNHIECRDIICSAPTHNGVINSTTNSDAFIQCRDVFSSVAGTLIIVSGTAQLSIKGRDFISTTTTGTRTFASVSGTGKLDLEFETAISDHTGISGFGTATIKAKGRLLSVTGVDADSEDAAILLGNTGNTYLDIDVVEMKGTQTASPIRVDGSAQLYIRNCTIKAHSPNAVAVLYRHTATGVTNKVSLNGVFCYHVDPTKPMIHIAASATGGLHLYSHGETFTNCTVLFTSAGGSFNLQGGTIVLGSMLPPL